MSAWLWDTSWLSIALVLGGAAAVATLFFVGTSKGPLGRRLGLAGLRLGAIALLSLCLLNPTRIVTEPTPGENRLLLAVDRSRSMEIAPPGEQPSPWDRITAGWDDEAGWHASLQSRFAITSYSLGERLRVRSSGDWPIAAPISPLFGQVAELSQRQAGNPIAGIVLLTDGVATDEWPSDAAAWSAFPIFPVLVGADEETPDLRLTAVHATPTLFEASPLIVTATIEHHGLVGKRVVVWIDEVSGERQDQGEFELVDETPLTVRLEVPELTGALGRFQVGVRLADEPHRLPNSDPAAENRSVSLTADGDSADEVVGERDLTPAPAVPKLADSSEPPGIERRSIERTLINNQRRLVVPRPVGPYRILYLGGRPNWEFKFLRRAAQQDPEVELVGLLRMADREPRFAFMDQGAARNRFYDGFRDATDESQEEYDEPVMVRIGTKSPEELASGFPRTEAELFSYGAIVLDDVEASFFDQEQLELLRAFVERRGGGLLLLGGPRAFSEGEWSDTSMAEMSPVYVERQAGIIDERAVRWEPTRDGWLTHWARLRDQESGEIQARAALPDLLGVNRVGGPKPAATVLALTDGGAPLLVHQDFGRGRTAALMASDLHRWQLLGDRPATDSQRTGLGALHPDFGRQWRQLLRWLVSDLPRRVSISTTEIGNESDTRQELIVKVLTDGYRPDDQAFVQVTITDPTGVTERMASRPTSVPGEYRVETPLIAEGEYTATAVADGVEEVSIGEATTAWIWEPSAKELQASVADRQRWHELAERTGGHVVELNELSGNDWLDPAQLPHVVTREESLWHRWPMLLAALGLLVAEWGWRRARGLA